MALGGGCMMTSTTGTEWPKVSADPAPHLKPDGTLDLSGVHMARYHTKGTSQIAAGPGPKKMKEAA